MACATFSAEGAGNRQSDRRTGLHRPADPSPPLRAEAGGSGAIHRNRRMKKPRHSGYPMSVDERDVPAVVLALGKPLQGGRSARARSRCIATETAPARFRPLEAASRWERQGRPALAQWVGALSSSGRSLPAMQKWALCGLRKYDKVTESAT